MNIPAPGVYEDIPFDQYAAWNAMNISTLLHGQRSMAHLQTAIQRPVRKRTKAMWRGVLGHTLVIEPLTAMDKYVVMPKFEDDPLNLKANGSKPRNPTSTSWYQNKKKEFELTNIAREVVTQDRFDEMREMIRALDKAETAKAMLKGADMREISLVWVDPETGTLCKGRLDLVDEDAGLLIDLKVVEDASRFERSISQYSYHIRMASYIYGWSILCGQHLLPWLMVVEGSSPFGIRSAVIGQETMALGLAEYKTLLGRYRRCRETKNWPGYEDPDEWNLPGVGGPDMQNYGLKFVPEEEQTLS